jgi:hypothetical protein
MNTAPDKFDPNAVTTNNRPALGGVSAMIAVAIAITAVLGTLSAGLVQSDRLAEDVVARYATVAIVRSVERARERDQDVPSGAIGCIAKAGGTRSVVHLFAFQMRGGVSLARLGPTQIDLPPPLTV